MQPRSIGTAAQSWSHPAAPGQEPETGHTQQHRDSSPKLVTTSSIGTAARNWPHPASPGQQPETGHTQQHRDSSPKLVTPSSIGTAAPHSTGRHDILHRRIYTCIFLFFHAFFLKSNSPRTFLIMWPKLLFVLKFGSWVCLCKILWQNAKYTYSASAVTPELSAVLNLPDLSHKLNQTFPHSTPFLLSSLSNHHLSVNFTNKVTQVWVLGIHFLKYEQIFGPSLKWRQFTSFITNQKIHLKKIHVLGVGEGRVGSLGLADINCYLQGGQTTRPCSAAQGALSSIWR